MRRLGWSVDVVAIAAALLVKFVPLTAGSVERRYSNGAYPPIDRAVRALTGPLPFTVGDVLLFVALFFLIRYWLVAIGRAKGRRLAATARVAVRTLAIVAAVYVWFAASWAFNYSRVPLADKIRSITSARTRTASARFADHVTDELSETRERRASRAPHGRAIRERANPAIRRRDRAPRGRRDVRAAADQADDLSTDDAGFRQRTALPTPGRTKSTSMRRRISTERPAIYAHEWAHISGFADESEANFISVIACTTSKDPMLAYSGWILVWFNLPTDVHLTHPMGKTAYDDIMAIRARYVKQVNKQVEHAQRAVYDTYLKQNHVKAGFASYRLLHTLAHGRGFRPRRVARRRAGRRPLTIGRVPPKL